MWGGRRHPFLESLHKVTPVAGADACAAGKRAAHLGSALMRHARGVAAVEDGLQVNTGYQVTQNFQSWVHTQRNGKQACKQQHTSQ